MDFARAGLLDGLEEPDRQARLELLERLAADGATLEELTQAVHEDRLALLLIERRLGGRHTAREVERATGVPADLMLRLRRLLGLAEAAPDDRVFSDEDVEQARATRLFLELGFDVDGLAELTRVLGESMARIAASATGLFAETFLRPGENEREAAERFDELAERLLPAIRPVLLGTFNAHLRESIHRGMIGRAELETGRPAFTQDLSVCFADLVGFTRLGGEIEVHELGHVAGRLATLAAEAAVPPVRLVKTIGDAVLFVSTDTAALVRTALALVAAAEAEDLPSLRAGVAFGPAVQRAGDYFGHSVNLASRVTGVARPGSVLCTEEVQQLAGDGFSWSYAGRFRLKGVEGTVPLMRAREPEPASGASAIAETEATSRPRADRRRRRASR